MVAGQPPPPPGNSKPWASRVAGWGRHKEGLCAAWLGCPQDSGGGSKSRFPSPFCFLWRLPECPELLPSQACPAHPEPCPLSFLGLGVQLQTPQQ